MTIGSKVVCIDDSPCITCGKPLMIRKNTVYVISRLQMRSDGEILVNVIGLNPETCHTLDGRNGYIHTRFRLLDDLKTNNLIKQLKGIEQSIEILCKPL